MVHQYRLVIIKHIDFIINMQFSFLVHNTSDYISNIECLNLKEYIVSLCNLVLPLEYENIFNHWRYQFLVIDDSLAKANVSCIYMAAVQNSMSRDIILF